jgi:hypothetical protein
MDRLATGSPRVHSEQQVFQKQLWRFPGTDEEIVTQRGQVKSEAAEQGHEAARVQPGLSTM